MTPQLFPPVPLQAVKGKIASLFRAGELHSRLMEAQSKVHNILMGHEHIDVKYRMALCRQTVAIAKICSMSQPVFLGASVPTLERLVETSKISHFKRLLHVAKNQPKWEVDRAEVILAIGWCVEALGLPPLCLFADDALTSLFRAILNKPLLQMGSLRKTRQRLELTKPFTPAIHSVSTRKEMIEFSPAKQ